MLTLDVVLAVLPMGTVATFTTGSNVDNGYKGANSGIACILARGGSSAAGPACALAVRKGKRVTSFGRSSVRKHTP